ncbi:MAG: CxxxxCH/CxxCH domain-containing protein, partial [Nitrospirae bacterium]
MIRNIMKRIKIEGFVALLLFGMLMLPLASHALDAPHINTPGYNISCGNCHWTSGVATPPWNSVTYPDANDNTVNNRRCYLCHDGATAPIQKTHSSTTTSATYWATLGGWQTECISCHNPHEQRQTRMWTTQTHLASGSFTAPSVGSWVTSTNQTQITLPAGLAANYNGYYFMPDKKYPVFYKIKAPADTTGQSIIQVKGKVETSLVLGNGYAIVYAQNVKDLVTYVKPDGTSINKIVKLYRPTGANNGADGDATYDGICEVCHTATTYYKNDGSGGAHNTGANCAQCHDHIGGFKPACGGCHGNPPTVSNQSQPNGLVWITSTRSASAGAHNLHVNTDAIACSACHVNSVGSGPTHNNARTISMGFSFNGATGGTYNGQAAAIYNSSDGGLTTTSSGGAMQCSNIYCHGSTMAAGAWGTDAGTNRAPNWTTNAAAGACGTCHKATAANPPASGSHIKHASSAAGNYNVSCDLCHPSAASGTHVNANVEYSLSTSDPRTNGGLYNGSASGGTGLAPSTNFKNCTNLYCHSTGTATYYSASWGSAGSGACGTCHGANATATPSSVRHGQHVGNAQGYKFSCSKCHDSVVMATADSTGWATIKSTTLHVDGTKNVKFDIYNSIGNYAGSNCSAIYCHSAGTAVATGAAPVASADWNTTMNCAGCHGIGTSDGRPNYANYTPKANSHMAVESTTHANHPCQTCHFTTTSNGTSITSFSRHVNKSYDVAPWGSASFSYTFNATGGTCSAVSCHGGNPGVWGSSGSLGCGSCHAVNNTLLGQHSNHWATAGFGTLVPA